MAEAIHALEVTAGTDTLCPICHEPRETHDCTTKTKTEVDDNWFGGGRRSTVALHIYCHHPETHHMAERARRYHTIARTPETP